jgi:hypothetical protein
MPGIDNDSRVWNIWRVELDPIGVRDRIGAVQLLTVMLALRPGRA